MHRTLRRFSRLSTLAAAGIAVVGSGVFVMTASYSSFTAQTANPASTWTAGSVKLSDDDGGTTLFSTTAVGNLKPGASGFNCITVTSTGTLSAPVRVWGTVTDGGLAQYLTLKVEEGTGGGFGNCTGWTAGSPSLVFNNTLDSSSFLTTNYATGASAQWTPSGSGTDSRVYKVTYTLSNTTPDTAQGKTVAVALTWEAQNN